MRKVPSIVAAEVLDGLEDPRAGENSTAWELIVGTSLMG